MAAAVAGLLTVRAVLTPDYQSSWVVQSQLDSLPVALSERLPQSTSREPIRAAGLRPTSRDLDSEVIGVVAEDGSIYWVEVDRTRTTSVPEADSSVRLTSGDM
jgi:hypothetical protein